jgi:lysine 2,3-aminomutase
MMVEQQEKTLLKKSFVKEIEKVELWEEFLSRSVVNEDQLDKICKGTIDKKKLKEVIDKYPMRINPYYLSLIKSKDDAIWKQAIPDVKELEDPEGLEDPLCEERDSPVPGLTHRYPDRVLFLVCNQCAMYCRFCTRKRKVGDPFKRITRSQILRGIEYIKGHPEIRDVLLSGGDPLLLSDNYLEWILKELRAIKHVEIIRIGTRVPCALPHRVTPELCNMLKKYHPLYVNVHFAHPAEITELSSSACSMLADAGILLSSQTVLLKGVNDDPKVMKDLMQKLLKIRVRPYYIYQADMTKGINHFRAKVEKGMEIISSIQGWTSGLAVPHFVIDSPGGGGKIPILPNYVVSRDDKKIVLRNYSGKTYTYDEHC